MANTPSIDYTSRDFEGLRQSLLDYAAQAFPEWSPGSEGDFGVLLLEMLAYVGDVNAYYVDRAQREAHLGTASQRGSVLQIANLLGYVPSNGTPATGSVTLETAEDGTPASVPAGTRLATDYVPDIDGQIIFETNEEVVVPGGGGTVTVTVTEGETKTEDSVGESDGLPDQGFQLASPNVYDGTVRIYVADEEWTEVGNLLDAEPESKVFQARVDQNGYTWIYFGDGLNGAVPALGLRISGTYRVGYGGKGNVEAGRVVGIYDSTLTGVTIQTDPTNNTRSTSSAMIGGSDPESTEVIRLNAPRAFQTRQRAITLEDYENFALAVPGVAKAKAICGTFSSVTLYIVGPNGSAPSQDLLDRVTEELGRRTLANVSVTVGSTQFIPINVGSEIDPVTVEVWPNFSRSAVERSAEQALESYLAFTNNNPGARLNVSDIYKVLMTVEGVRYVDIPVMARSDAAQTGTSEIQLRPWEFPVLGTIHLTSTGGII